MALGILRFKNIDKDNKKTTNFNEERQRFAIKKLCDNNGILFRKGLKAHHFLASFDGNDVNFVVAAVLRVIKPLNGVEMLGITAGLEVRRAPNVGRLMDAVDCVNRVDGFAVDAMVFPVRFAMPETPRRTNDTFDEPATTGVVKRSTPFDFAALNRDVIAGDATLRGGIFPMLPRLARRLNCDIGGRTKNKYKTTQMHLMKLRCSPDFKIVCHILNGIIIKLPLATICDMLWSLIVLRATNAMERFGRWFVVAGDSCRLVNNDTETSCDRLRVTFNFIDIRAWSMD